MSKTREELIAIAKTHAASEATGDLAATLATLEPEPLYELATVGLAFRGMQAAHRYYEHFFGVFQPQIAGYELRGEWVTEEGVGQEYVIHLRLADGARERHFVIGVLTFGENALAGERVYASERLLRLMFGPVYAEAERRGRITCRAAEVSDAPAIARAHVAGWKRGYAGIVSAAFLATLGEEQRARRWDQILREQRGVLVVEVEGRVEGFSGQAASRDADAKPSTGEVTAIYLHPDAWRHGAGSVLLAEAERALRRAGYAEVTLWVLEANTRARAFYEARGWRHDGTARIDTALIGEPLSELRYRKEL